MNNAKEYPDEECNCPLMDRQILNAGAGSWTTSMDWYCPIHGQQHRDYEKPKGWGGDWTPQQQHEWSQSIKHAMNKQNENKVEPKLEFEEDDGPNAAGNQSKYNDPNYKSDFDRFVEEHPDTDVSWEEEFDKQFASEIDSGENIKYAPAIKSFIRNQINLARDEGFDAGGKTVGGTGRVMYMEGKKKTIAEEKTRRSIKITASTSTNPTMTAKSLYAPKK